MNEVFATTVTVYASRTEVNVILPGTGYRGEGNHHFARPKGPIDTWIKDLVTQVINSEESIKWKARGFEVLHSAPAIERGKYSFSIWIPKR